ncbi:hypothetical protein OAB41_01275 [Gammaproteobacteria bacterium]|jgi:hypothetical protein|nr:hypothetical protein [Gammaproteobacteria bacterium]MDA7844632.1 hypothetical protein [Gammaproteobacteria bacterium]MDA8933952.1 hypothetical protein [Gammaproteobacteria bacterium]MDB2582806.1 hypothetical protein [Gammaproteobacteria bacterium]MDB9747366.1 hypothetical protein [Gammaproteobacteria bacterium]|tara:strand:- start:49 stop:255 length:207 start_codon:yes stop_codon:yes gene_type:complete
MSDNASSNIEILKERIDLLIKRFDEQKGIINSYVGRERDWKQNKIIQGKEISELKNQIEILTAKVSDE